MAKKKGGKVQSILFKRDKWSVAKAKQFLAKHTPKEEPPVVYCKKHYFEDKQWKRKYRLNPIDADFFEDISALRKFVNSDNTGFEFGEQKAYTVSLNDVKHIAERYRDWYIERGEFPRGSRMNPCGGRENPVNEGQRAFRAAFKEIKNLYDRFGYIPEEYEPVIRNEMDKVSKGLSKEEKEKIFRLAWKRVREYEFGKNP